METYFEFIVALRHYSGEWKIKHIHSWTGSEREFLIDLFQEDTSLQFVRVLEVVPHSKMK